MEKEATIICAANLTGTDKCPRDCRNCIYGGDIAITWTEYAYGIERDFIQYFPSREAVKQAFHEAQGIYDNIWNAEVANNSVGQKITTLQTWLNKNFPEWWKP